MLFAGIGCFWTGFGWRLGLSHAIWNTAFELEFAGIGLELYSKSRDCAGVGCFWLELNWNIFKKMSQFELLVLNCFLLEFDWNWTGICWNLSLWLLKNCWNMLEFSSQFQPFKTMKYWNSTVFGWNWTGIFLRKCHNLNCWFWTAF